MPEVTGFEVLTSVYLGQDWDLYGSTADEAIALFLRQEGAENLTASIAGLEELLGSHETEAQYDHRWIFEFRSAYDPARDGRTYRQWFEHVLALLLAAPS